MVRRRPRAGGRPSVTVVSCAIIASGIGAIIPGTSHGQRQRRSLPEEPMMSPEPDTVRGISAVTLATHDMRRAVRFYQALGLLLHYGGDGPPPPSTASGPGPP